MSVIINCPLLAEVLPKQMYAVITKNASTWAGVLFATDGDWMFAYLYLTDIYANQDINSPYDFSLSRGFAKFDLSGIPSTLTPIAAAIKGDGANFRVLLGYAEGYLAIFEYTGADPWTLADFDEFGDLYGYAVLPDFAYPLPPCSVPLTEAVALTNIAAAMASGKILMVFRNKADTDNIPPNKDYPATWEVQRIGNGGALYLEVECEGPPIVSGVNPAISGRDQSLEVYISGVLFTGATAVSFGAGITVSSFVVDDDSNITAQIRVSAGATIGLRDVSVTTTFGTGTLVDGFEVIIPVVSSVYPVAFGRGQDCDVSIYGQAFTGVTSISFGAGITEYAPVEFLSDTELLAHLTIDPAATLGTRDVSVTNAVDTGTLVDGFEVVEPPIVTSIAPNTGAQGDTLVGVVLVGTGFTQPNFWAGLIGMAGGIVNIVVDSDVHVTCDVIIDPSETPGVYDVEVDTDYGWGTLVGGFTVTPGAAVPVVTSATPNTGAQGQHLSSVVIAGSAFTDAIAVSFGAGITVNGFSVDNDTQITADITISPSATPGNRDISVTNSAGTGVLLDGFTVLLSGSSQVISIGRFPAPFICRC